MAETGYLVIADISGYTAFLSQSELEHARDSLNSLLGLLVEYTRRPLLISRLQGDAVFSYALDGNVIHGQTLVDLIENTYLAFRKARQLMVLNTTCQCQACVNIPNLDLKFFIHHGEYDFQDVGQYKELVGTDVNTIHRLTKNTIVETTGIKAYTAYTGAALEALDIDDWATHLTEHTEHYEHIGKVPVFIQDLNALWVQERESLRYEVDREKALFHIDAVFQLPPAVLWHYLTDPKHRAVVHGSEWQKLVEKPDGRVGPGAVYECSHGTYISRNTIVDWHPFEQYTTYETTPVPRTHVYVTYLLEPVEDGTRLSYICSRTYGSFLLRKISDLGGGRIIPARISESFHAFQDYINEEIASGRASAEPAGDITKEAIEQAVTASLTRKGPEQS